MNAQFNAQVCMLNIRIHKYKFTTLLKVLIRGVLISMELKLVASVKYMLNVFKE